MNNSNMDILIKPSPIFALIKTVPFTLFSAGCLFLANRYFPDLVWLSMVAMVFAAYRYLYIRKAIYLVTREYIRITRGILFRQIDTVELFRIKDYAVTEPFLLQIFSLMDVHLKTTDPENPDIWLRGIPESGLIDVIRVRVLETRQYNKIVEIN
jgi:uncharacterized membrane protein YdbT with pleckstrin-like domain